jgi:hypothetical protein
MVVKTEDYRLFADGDGKIIKRSRGENDAFCVINACGIRAINAEDTPKDFNQQIMTETFKAALRAAQSGLVIFPAVGMGVWRGDPKLYWTAFLDAVLSSSDDIEQIFVNPRHQKSKSGEHGNEFQVILDEYIRNNKDNDKATQKLRKIFNLYDSQKDVLQLAHQLKKAYPHLIISLFNASDPDVTLGFHVGQYVNNLCHTFTTEENYAAAGTSPIKFEGITRVHHSIDRLVQIKADMPNKFDATSLPYLI